MFQSWCLLQVVKGLQESLLSAVTHKSQMHLLGPVADDKNLSSATGPNNWFLYEGNTGN